MSGSATPPAIPPDVRHALSAAAALIAGLRTACKTLRMQVFSMNFCCRRVATPVGVMRSHRAKDGWDDEITACSPWLLSVADKLDPLLRECRKATSPLQAELRTLSRGWSGGYWSHVQDSVMFAVCDFIGRDLPVEIRKMVAGRTTPFVDAEIIALAARYEAVLDDLDAEIVREAKQLAIKREREALLASPAEEPPLSDRQYDVLDAIYAAKAFSPDTRATTDDVAARLNLDSAQLKIPISALVGLKLLASKKGRGGGVWLTDAGRKQVESQRKR